MSEDGLSDLTATEVKFKITIEPFPINYVTTTPALLPMVCYKDGFLPKSQIWFDYTLTPTPSYTGPLVTDYSR